MDQVPVEDCLHFQEKYMEAQIWEFLVARDREPDNPHLGCHISLYVNF